MDSSTCISSVYSVCSICLEEVNKKKSILLECNHYYHIMCLISWKPDCPLCRAPINLVWFKKLLVDKIKQLKAQSRIVLQLINYYKQKKLLLALRCLTLDSYYVHEYSTLQACIKNINRF